MRASFWRKLRPALAAPIIAATVAGFAMQPAVAQEKVTVGGASTTVQTLGVYYSSVPLELFWKDEGLDVTFIGLPGLNAALQALDAGKVDFVPGSNSALLKLLEKYPEAGLKAYFTHVSAFNAMMPAVAADSPIKTIADIEGKTIGVQRLNASQVALTKALLKLAGGDPESLTFVAAGEGLEAAHALETGRVDVLALYDGLYAAIEGEGVKLRELESDSVNREKVGFFAALIARGQYLKEHRDIAIKVARGMAKATLFAQTNPEAAVRIHWKHYPATKPRGVSDEEAMKLSLMPMMARLRNIEQPEGLFGNSTDEQIKGYMKILVAGGLLDKEMDISTFWDPSMLKEINDFDREAVIKMAKEWKPSE